MIVKRVAGAIGAELQAINLGDGIEAELARAFVVPVSSATSSLVLLVVALRSASSASDLEEHGERVEGTF